MTSLAWLRVGGYATVSASEPEPAPELLGRDFTTGVPDQRWAGDIT